MDLASFEREALKLIETGGYVEAITQLERLSTLIDEIVHKLRKKLPRKDRVGGKKAPTDDHPQAPKPKARATSAGLERLTAQPKHKQQQRQKEDERAAGAKPSRAAASDDDRQAAMRAASPTGSFTPWDEPSDARAQQQIVQSTEERHTQLLYKITHLEAKVKKYEDKMQTKEEQAAAAETERQRLARTLEAKEKSLMQLKGVMRGIQKEKAQKEDMADRERAVASHSDRTVQLEAELRKRAAIVSQQEIALGKWQAKAKTLECKLRLAKEQEKKVKEEAAEQAAGGLGAGFGLGAAGAGLGAKGGRRPGSRPGSAASKGSGAGGGGGEDVAVYKEKLRAMKEALKFTTDELESREVEVAQLRVAQQMAEEETEEWRAQKDIIDKKVKHSSTALRNVLQDKEKTQEKLTQELTEMESSLIQQAASFEEQNARLRSVLEQKEHEIERLRNDHDRVHANGTTYQMQQALDFDTVTVPVSTDAVRGGYDNDADLTEPGMDMDMGMGMNDGGPSSSSQPQYSQPPRSQRTLPPLTGAGAGAADLGAGAPQGEGEGEGEGEEDDGQRPMSV
jgi:hypothetical protein